MHKVCRAYSQSPDGVREWEYSDYLDAMESLGEIPMVDEGFYWIFFGAKGEEEEKVAKARNELEEFGKKLRR